MLATLLRITRWTLDRGVWVRALVGSFRFIAGKENEMLKDNLRWVGIPSRVKEGGGGGGEISVVVSCHRTLDKHRQ